MSTSPEAGDPGRTYPCPACLTPATLDGPCPGCGRAPDPDAAEVARVDARLAALGARIGAAHAEMNEMFAEVRALHDRRRRLVHRINAAVPRPTRPAAETPAAAEAPAADETPADAAPATVGIGGTRDASPRTVQNLLFVVGALLLGVGAIIFTAVAWQVYGITGRAIILGTVTAIAFAVPLVALRQRLAATAETFAAIALLLLALDGVALWSLNLFGVRAMSTARYTAVVCAVVAVVAAGYAVPTRLVGPRFAALTVAQPALPLAVVTRATPLAATSGVLTTIALGNVLVAAVHGRAAATRPAQRAVAIVATVFAGVSLAGGTWIALFLLLRPRGVNLGADVAAVAAAAAVLAVAGRFARWPEVRAAAVAGSVVQAALIGTRVVSHMWPGQGTLAGALMALLTTAAVAAVPARLWFARGLLVGASAVVGAVAVRIGVTVLAATLGHTGAVTPLWHADLGRLTSPPLLAEPWVPVVVAIVGICAMLLLRRARRVAVAAAIMTALLPLAVPVSVGLTWWAGPVLDAAAIVALAAAAVVALRRGDAEAETPIAGSGGWDGFAAVAGMLAIVLGGHAAWLSLVRPVTTAATFGGVAVLATALVALVTSAPERPVRTAFAGAALCAGMLALPVAVAAAFASAGHAPDTLPRAAIAAVGACLALLVPVHRRRPELAGYAVVAIWITATVCGLIPLVRHPSEHPVLYALTALVVTIACPLVAGVRGQFAPATTVPALVLAAAALPTTARAVGALLVEPYGNLSHAWSGVPGGTGVPGGLDAADVVALLLAAVACALAGLLVRGRPAMLPAATAPAVVAGLAALAAAGAPWPAVPAASLLLGLAATVWWVRALDEGRGLWVGAAGAALLGAGGTGLVPTRAGSICTLGALLVGAVVCGVVGRTEPRRVGSWLAAVTASGGLAVVAPRAAGAAPGVAAVTLAATAAAVVLAGAAMRRRGRAKDGTAAGEPRRAIEATALEAAGHAAAVVALALSSDLVEAAVLSSAWGAVTGVRGVLPALTRRARIAHAAAAAGLQVLAWWLLAADLGIHRIDAYTAPLAVVALLAGWLAARADPTLSSWTAYAAGLLVGFVPATFPLLAEAGIDRRVALGLAGLLVLLVGAVRRLQAPAVIGGATVSLVALHELVLLWQRLPTWAPLSAAGILLLALAVTFERRRRDWNHLRTAVSRMT